MATKTASKKRATKKAAPPPETVDEVDDEEIEETDDDEAGEAQPFGVRDICALIEQKTGEEVKPRELRTLIRKMAREDDPRVQREVIPGNKARYEWSGPNDPEVKAIVKAYKDGELAADRAEKLAALKERKEKQKAAAEKSSKSGKKTAKGKTKKKAPVVVEDDDDDEELDDE